MFGRALKKLRTEAGLTQQELEEKSHVNRTTIADLEASPHKQPRWETITKLAEGLGVGLDSFVDAARRYVEPPLDRLELLEGRVAELENRTAGLEDRQLEAAKIATSTRGELRQLRTLVEAGPKRRRPS